MGLRRSHRITIAAAGLVFAGVLVAFVLVCKSQAHTLVTNPAATRGVPTRTPADFHMPYDEATVTTDDGLKLVGWWVPPEYHGVVMIVPGYKGHRGQLLGVAEILHRYGYCVLILSLRGLD